MNRRGQTEVKLVLAMAAAYSMVGVAAADAVQATNPQHLLDERAIVQWLLVALAGGIVYFLKRLLNEHHEQEQRINRLERDVHAIAVVCKMQHGVALPMRRPADPEDNRDD